MMDAVPESDRIRLLIVDDEPPARERLRHLLEDLREVAIVGEATNGSEAVELCGPEALVAIEPVVGLLHRSGLQPAGDRAPTFAARDQPGARQDVEVLHDRRQRHGERLGQIADRNAVGLA